MSKKEFTGFNKEDLEAKRAGYISSIYEKDAVLVDLGQERDELMARLGVIEHNIKMEEQNLNRLRGAMANINSMIEELETQEQLSNIRK